MGLKNQIATRTVASSKAVEPEADERDRAGRDPSRERDGELDQIPTVPDVREQLRGARDAHVRRHPAAAAAR